MNFRYYNTSKLIILVIVSGLIIEPFSNFLEDYIKSIPFFKNVYNYIGIFSTLTLLGLEFWFINKILWKYNCMNWLIDIPDLNGRYEGKLISSYVDPKTNKKVEKLCVLEITQDASSIKIHGYYGDLDSQNFTSESNSVSEQIIKGSNGIFEVFYIYNNNPKLLLDLNTHVGTCYFKYYPDKKLLEGEYYTQRGTKGELEVIKINSQRIGRLF